VKDNGCEHREQIERKREKEADNVPLLSFRGLRLSCRRNCRGRDARKRGVPFALMWKKISPCSSQLAFSPVDPCCQFDSRFCIAEIRSC